ncbi:hypothetical protein C9F11_38105 [Streptomyces sp. YIM 121038]|uniref:hypothetical protein n=1 Tax=Streptomyces sp. YIM 121038 TaxID=2136401 RepID=UPI001164A267|nr:hypothetical protein [Streptomyces sp. YIM 121038]QCX81204.1 hypothetical protein C9F11_38105 [Streptomyces sp. YIM 121038]
MTDQLPRRFHLVRDVDETGTSGVGIVVEGLEFTDGTVALRWLTATTSTAIYASMADVETIHGHGGKTRVVWVDDHTTAWPEPAPAATEATGPATYDGPSITEAAADDRRWWEGERDGE